MSSQNLVLIRDLPRVIGKLLRTSRKSRGLTKGAFSKLLGVTSARLQEVEEGHVGVELQILQNAAVLLGGEFYVRFLAMEDGIEKVCYFKAGSSGLELGLEEPVKGLGEEGGVG